MYQKRPASPPFDERIRPVPFSDSVSKASFELTSNLTVYYEETFFSLKDINDCTKPADISAFLSSTLYRYVLIPVPTAKSRPAPSSLSTPLERAGAWYSLNDLSYETVKQRFGLKD